MVRVVALVALIALLAPFAALALTSEHNVYHLDPHKVNLPLPQTEQEETAAFSAFKAQFRRQYASLQEENDRFANFRVNLRTIATRREQFPQAVFNINKFADWSSEEFTAMKGGKNPFPAAAVAKSCLASGVTKEEVNDRLMKARSVGVPPKTFSWLDRPGIVTPVKNQGQCGSCWAFSTTGSIESATALKTGQLVGLSEQEVVDCSNACTNEPPYGNVCNQGCNGGWPWAAMFDVASWKGLATEAAYPYTAVTGTCSRTAAMDHSPIVNYTCLSGTGNSNDGPANEDDMLSYCFANGPLSMAMDASPLQFYFGGVVDPWGYSPDGCSQASLDHALLIVGWGTYDSWLWGEQPYWLIKNSWGADWGENGYFMLFRGSNMCGVASAISHPNV